MRHIQGGGRAQPLLLPASVKDHVGTDNPVRAIEAFVDGFDLAKAGFVRAEAEATGRPGYHPSDLLKLYLYGHLNRIRSSRRLEAQTHRNLEVMWLLRRLRPDFKTIADFRHENAPTFKAAFRHFVRLCRQLDLFGRERASHPATRRDLPRCPAPSWMARAMIMAEPRRCVPLLQHTPGYSYF